MANFRFRQNQVTRVDSRSLFTNQPSLLPKQPEPEPEVPAPPPLGLLTEEDEADVNIAHVQMRKGSR